MRMENGTESERIAAWIERSRLLYIFYADSVAKDLKLPLAVVEEQLRKMVAAGEIVVRFWEVYCDRCDQTHEFSTPKVAEDEVCLRCGEDLDPTQAVPLYGFRREIC